MTSQYREQLPGIPAYAPAGPGDAVMAAIRHDYLGFLGDVAGHCGDIGSYRRNGQQVVLVNSPGLARELLVDRADATSKGDLQRTALSALLQESISVSEGERHRMLRRLLAPLLGPRQVPGYAERIVRTASAFCSAWSQAEPMDLFNELYRLTLHTMGRSLIDEDPMWDERGQFWAGRQLLWDWITSQSGQGRRLAGAADPLRDNKVVAAVTTIQDVLDHLLEHRIGDASPPADMLSALMTANKRAGCPLSPADVRDQIVALLFAAHETTACALFWSLYLLDCHPHARQRLECELDEIAPRPAYDVTAFPYTLQVLKEAMRLYPPAGRQFRVTTTSTTLGEYHLPEGMPVTVCQYLLHRRKESFPEPERFDPERFAPAAPYPAAAYLPFGAGRRACLGRHYALLETQVLLAYLAGHFRFQFSGPARAQLSVTVRPQGRVMAVVRRRSR